MKYKVFVDGSEGTTGLKIHEYLCKREDIEILSIESKYRKDIEARQALLNEADIVFLCLPDAAAKESISLINNKETRIIDASTAHRTNIDWTYGLPELNNKQRDKIKNSKRVTVPGCHATGFIALLYPLVGQGIVPKDYPIIAYSISGYSGGGKKLIKWCEDNHFSNMNSPKPYRLDLNHKHLPEMQKITGLSFEPAFTPMISNYYKGMSVSIPLFSRLLSNKYTVFDIHKILLEYYQDEKFINVIPQDIENSLEDGYLNVEANNDTNRLDIFVSGNENKILITSRLDNLGKGASGAAIQNMNLMLGLKEDTGLKVY
ncbi:MULTISPECIES: N-acetyl-gamma-glutamyl-phosphate reductase [unclassified Clostridium]|uniref:N-acetyl-gamma-glutamyl-phosphate reductase n=1 Tax=unclassified Clostridium TaxID=2614128 RepID=UPI00029800A4|nr:MULTISPECIES: N-acetyl-gamma-glutamyl-phosphate reductase [unclassified Clostridium]EKQ54471.1 MAG: N-acetyl-gamma-glutamyl-phosphate reductase, uncommon form [Clostridium sp. Maddingley MBC34-26]